MMGFINYLINGISLGSVYAIIALGYTMVYGIAKMLNFAHGDIIMVGSYTVFITTRYLGMPTFLSVLLAVVVCTLLGIVIERVAYKPLRDASPLSVLITAIGVSYLLQNVALLLFGADTKSFTSVVTIPALKFADGAIKAQLGTPDMRLPIQYALTFPERPDYGGQRFDFARTPSLTFEEVDGDKFPALGIAYECLERGGTAPCTMNAANEVAVAAFLQGRIGYSDIVRLIERALEQADFLPSPTVEDYTACDREVRGMVSAML